MAILHSLGFKTFASIEPVITWQMAHSVIKDSLKYCDHYKIGLRSGVGKDYYNKPQSVMWLERITKNIVEEGKTLYLKNSVRRLLSECFTDEALSEFLKCSVGMDYNMFGR